MSDATPVQIHASPRTIARMKRTTGPGRAGGRGRGAADLDAGGRRSEPLDLRAGLVERLPPLLLRGPVDVLDEDDRAAEPLAGEVARDRARVGAGVRVAMVATVDPTDT